MDGLIIYVVTHTLIQ